MYSATAPAAATPVISLATGVYPGEESVTITDAMPSSTIYYTTNGTYPTTSSAQYLGPISVISSETLVAAAIAPGYSLSLPASAEYLIQPSTTPFIYTVAGDGMYGFEGDGGPATLSIMNLPRKAITDSSGNLYIADTDNNRVRKVTATTGAITTVAGNGTAGYSGDNSAAVDAELNYPVSLALDSTGNLYITDTNNNVIRMVSAATGIITTFAGNGIGGYGGDGGPATSAELSYPQDISVDGANNLYIADTNNFIIRKVTQTTGIITTVAGSAFNFGYSGDGGPATSASMYAPWGVAADSAGDFWIADTYNMVIRKVTASTGLIATVAGNGDGAFGLGGNGTGGYTGDGGPATSAELYFPTDVAVDNSGNLYIDDSANDAVREVYEGGIINTVAGNGSECVALSYGFAPSGDGGPATSGGFCLPYAGGIAVDNTGNLYIADTYDSRIRKVTVGAPFPSAATAAPVFSIPGGTYAGAQSLTLTDSTPGASIYISLDSRIPNGSEQLGYYGPINISGTVTVRAIAVAPGHLPSAVVTAIYTITSSPVAVISTFAGDGVYGYTGVGGPPTSAQIGSPQGVAFDGSGNFYFTDTGNNVVWMVSAKTGVISVVAGDGTAGYSGDSGPAASAELNGPSGLTSDKAGDLYIADSNNYVVRRIDAVTRTITTFAGNGTSGYSGDNGPATSAELSGANGVALDGGGNLYISDPSNCRIREVVASTDIISTFAGNGICTYSGDDGPALSAGIPSPEAVAFDSSGNLYISDDSNRIRKVAASTDTITTVAGNGTMGLTGDGGPATSASVFAYALVVDANGNLYFSEMWPVVREVSAKTGIITTVAGTAYSGFSGDGGSATVAEMNDPAGLAFDGAGNLYIADTLNSRIRKVAFSPPGAVMTSPKPGSTVTGPSVTFTWTAVSGVTNYQLWLGTSGPGSSSLFNSGSTTATTATATDIPAYGATIYARLYSEVGGKWQWVDYTYTESGTPAVLLSPKASSTFNSTSQTFTWTAGAGVTNYQLWMGTSGAGSSSMYNSGTITATATTVPSIPAYGQTVYVRLYSEIAGAWQYRDYTFTEEGTPAVLTAPRVGSTLAASDVTFTWNTGEGVTDYQLWLGTSGAGSSNLYNSGAITTTSVTVPTLQANGVTLYARLYSETGGVWSYYDYTFIEAGTPGVMISPAQGSTLGSSSVTFTWTAGAGNTNYQLWLGLSGVGSSNLYNSGSITTTSITVPSLPVKGATVYARLYSESGGVWSYHDYTYIEQ